MTHNSKLPNKQFKIHSLKGQEGDQRSEVERSESPLLDSQLQTSKQQFKIHSLKGQEGDQRSGMKWSGASPR